jgi:HEAT repeat protein
LRAATGDVAFATAFGALTTGAFIAGFAKSLGASNALTNLLGALPSLMGILQIPGAILGKGSNSYRGFVRPGGLSWRVLYLGLVFLPIIAVSTGLRLTIVVVLIAVATGANALVGSMYNEWIAETVPPDSRGFFFGRRQAIGTGVGAVVGLLGGFLLDAFRNYNQEPLGFSVVFGFGLVCAAVSMFWFDRIRDIPRVPVKVDLKSGLRSIIDPFGDREFRKVLIYTAAAVFGQGFAGNMFAIYALEVLKLPYTVVQGCGLTYSVGIVLATKFWGSMSDKYGNKPMLALAGGLLGTNVIWWCLTVPGATTANTILLLSSHVLMGAIFCGAALCQFNLILATSKPEDRANYMGAGTALMAVVGGVAPLLGAKFIPEVHAAVGDYKILFAVTGVLRLLSVPLLFRVREHGSTDIRSTFADLRRLTPRSVGAMRRLSRSEDAVERAEAIHAVAEERAEMAGDTILAALHDPQPRVRREAARALARLQDPRAVAALLEGIKASPDLLEEETVDALGALGDAAAVPALVSALENPRPLLRRAAARALGRIGGDLVIAPLEHAVQHGDTDVRRAALQGLRQSEAHGSAEVVAGALSDLHPSVRVAAAEAIAELQMKAAAPALRKSLQRFFDEAEAEVAYALGVVGEIEDLAAIVEAAGRAQSVTTRRRALLGAARLLGAEREAYRLMLLSGMARDTALVERMRPLVKGSAAARLAMMKYGAGEEARAIEALVRLRPVLTPLAEHPVEEAFLVAVAAS